MSLLVDKAITILKPYTRFGISTDQNIKRKFLDSYSCLIRKPQPLSGKDLNKIAFAFHLLGEIDQQEGKKYTDEIEYDKGLTSAFNYLFSILFLPFPDLEQAAANVLLALTEHEFGIREFAKQTRTLDYLMKHYAKTKEIFDIKTEIKDKLTTGTFSFRVQEWYSQFLAQMKEMAEQTKQSEMMFIKSEAAQ